MTQGRIIILSGTPGVGKSTVSQLVAESPSMGKTVLLHMDDFYDMLVKGCIPPYLPESDDQNRTVIEAIAAAAKCFACDGYDVVVDGVFEPWLLDAWQRAADLGTPVHYVILHAAEQETLRRAVSRSKPGEMVNTTLVETMWPQFSEPWPYEKHVLDTTALTAQQTCEAVCRIIRDGSCLLTGFAQPELPCR